MAVLQAAVADDNPVNCVITIDRVSKRRTDCKVKDAYRLGKTLGTGGQSQARRLHIISLTGSGFVVPTMQRTFPSVAAYKQCPPRATKVECAITGAC